MTERIVYTIAKRYKPAKVGDYIRSLTYFTERTLTAYRQYLEQLQVAATGPIAEVAIDRTGRASPATRAARSTAGALAAADYAQLPEV